MRKRLWVIAVIFAMTVSARGSVLTYFRDRGADFLDIFLLRISAARNAKGFGFRARATGLAQIGAIYFEGEHFGLDRRAIGVWKERRAEGGISLAYFTSIENESVWGDYFLEPDTPWMNFQERGIIRNNIFWGDGRGHPLSVNAEIQAGILPGFEAGIYPTEILDFAAGFFTLDPQNDDLARVRKYTAHYPTEIEQPLQLEQLPENERELLKEMETLPEKQPTPAEKIEPQPSTQKDLTPEKKPPPEKNVKEKQSEKKTQKPKIPTEVKKKSVPSPNAHPAPLVTRSKSTKDKRGKSTEKPRKDEISQKEKHPEPEGK